MIGGNRSEIYHEEYQVEYFVADFFVPKANLIIEINSKQHFYPYTYKKDQVIHMKISKKEHRGTTYFWFRS